MSIPVTTTPPSGYRRVGWAGRLGTVCAVEGVGKDSNRPPVLLVPGMTGSKEDYFDLLGPLADLSWRAAAADLPGMADSPGPQDADHYSIDLFAGDVLGMIRSLGQGEPVHLVGHSVGGLIARAAALRSPDLVRSLTLYASGPGRVGEVAAASAQLLIGALEHYSPAEVYQMKLAIEDAQGLAQPAPQTANFLQKRWSSTTSGHFLALAGIALTEPDRSEELVRLRDDHCVPILMLYGTDDRTWPVVDMERYAARVGTETAVISGAGHSPAVEAPAATAAALDAFWRRT